MLFMVFRYSSSEKTRVFCLFVCFLSHFYFFSLWTSCGLRCRPFSPPPGTCLQFLSCIGFSIPTARRLPSNLTLSRFPRVNLCTRKSPYEFIRVCSRGHEDNLLRHRGDRLYRAQLCAENHHRNAQRILSTQGLKLAC